MSDEAAEAFERLAGTPLAWQWTARNLIAAANRIPEHKGAVTDALWRDFRPARLLLYGLALENLLKGLLIAQGTQATAAGRLSKALRTHDLPLLWSRARLPLTAERRALLTNLRWAIEAGKYPTGTEPESEDCEGLLASLVRMDEVLDALHCADQALHALLPGRTFEAEDLRWV